MKLLLGTALALSLLSGLEKPLEATVLQALTVPDLTDASDLVGLARVERIGPDLGPASPGFSYIVLQFLEPYKGAATGPVTVKLLGGQTTDDPASLRMEGAPSFRPGEVGVLFLSARPEEKGRYHNVTGWNQGYWVLGPDGATLTNGKPLGELAEEVRAAAKNPHASKLRRGQAGGTDRRNLAAPRTHRLKSPGPSRTKRALHQDGGDPDHPAPLTAAERAKRRATE